MKNDTENAEPNTDTETLPMPLDGPVDADLMQALARLAQASIVHNIRRACRAEPRGFDASPFPETDVGVAAYIMGLFLQARATSCAAIAVVAALSGPAVGGARRLWASPPAAC